LVAEEVLEDSSVPKENLWWDLKKAVAARKPNNITELEPSAHEEWAKIPKNRWQKLLSG